MRPPATVDDLRQGVVVVARVAVAFAVILAALAGGASLWDRWQRAQLAGQDPSSVFEYSSVEYRRTERDGLVMASTAAWFRTIDHVVWNDRLICQGSTFSTQETSAVLLPPRSLQTTEWAYASPYPTDDRDCVMLSTITAEINGVVFRQQLESSRFQPGPGKPLGG